MKIAFITPFFTPVAGGSATVPYYLAKHLVKRDHEVSIFTSDFGRNSARFNDERDLTIIESKIELNAFNLLYTPSLKSELEKNGRFDIFHSHNFRTYQNYVAYHYARRTNIPYVLQAHGSLPRIGSWKKLKQVYDVFFGYNLLRDTFKVIALNRFEAEQYKAMGVPEEKIAIIPNGIDLSEYTNLPPKGSFKSKHNIPEDKKIILYLGRIHRIKGIDFLIKAYAYLVKKTGRKDAILVIAGPDDGYLNEAKNLAKSLNLNYSIIFTGLLSEEDKIKAYVDSSVVVNVEPINVYGLVPLEAAACSTPVIVSKTNAISEVIREGNFGFSVKYNDTISLSSVMLKILNDEELAAALGRNGRKYVFENLGWEKIVEKYEQVYREIIESRKRS
ncbi:MAG: glycosyltransferase family 4 protein [candidate division WOR-3 bacterium]